MPCRQLKSAAAYICYLLAFFLMGGSALVAQGTPADTGSTIHVITVESIISPVSAEFITKSIDLAQDQGAHCLIVQLDTPGGLLESTRQITKSFLAAKIPVIVYVAPQGARAASAGVFISYAAHLVAMAPSTNIGAATPVTIGGGSPDTTSALKHKITNDAAAQVRTLAEKRGRNAEWAEKAVRDAVSITEREALDLNVINFISPSLDSLIAQLDGQVVSVPAGEYEIRTEGLAVVKREMNFRYRVLDKISNPNVAYILMMLGIYGLFFELSNPGSILPGVVGGICLILAFFALQTLPINYAGLLLIIVALILFVLEVKVVSYGMLTVGGVAAMILGSLMLIEEPPDSFAPALSISIGVIVTVVACTATFFIFAFSLAFKSHRRRVTTGAEGLVGEVGVAQTKLSPEGKVKVHGEIWSAAASESISKGARVSVIAVQGLVIKVKKV